MSLNNGGDYSVIHATCMKYAMWKLAPCNDISVRLTEVSARKSLCSVNVFDVHKKCMEELNKDETKPPA